MTLDYKASSKPSFCMPFDTQGGGSYGSEDNDDPLDNENFFN